MSTPGYKGARLRIPKRVHAICHAVTSRLAGFAIALSSLALASGAPTLNVTSDTAQEAETSIVAFEIGCPFGSMGWGQRKGLGYVVFLMDWRGCWKRGCIHLRDSALMGVTSNESI